MELHQIKIQSWKLNFNSTCHLVNLLSELHFCHISYFIYLVVVLTGEDFERKQLLGTQRWLMVTLSKWFEH